MVAYIDPNLFGLPVQAAAPWLAAIIGAIGGAACMLALRSWRCICSSIRRHGKVILFFLAITACLVWAAYAGWKLISSFTKGVDVVSAEKQSSLSLAKTSSRKVLVLGMDGLDPDLLRAMMDEGKLPAFDRLRKESGFQSLATVTPPQSPVVWSSFATGLGPRGHGIFDFIHRTASDYRLDLSINSPKPGGGYVDPRHGQTFWSMLSEHNIPVHILFSPCGFPPERVHGSYLAGMGTPDLKGNLGRYTLISSDPHWAEKNLRGELLGVAFTDDDLSFSLPGARIYSGGKSRDLTVEVTLRRLRSDAGIELRVNKQTVSISRHEWSPWVHLQFRAGLTRRIKGICRFYLVSLKPELNLYCTPIQFDPTSPAFDISHPSEFAGELAKALGPFATLGMPIDTKALEDGVLDPAGFLQLAESVVGERERILHYVLDRWDNGFIFSYFGSADPVQHMFWRDFLKDRLTDQGTKSLPEPIVRFYQRMDRILATVLNRLQDEPDTQVIVLSDHGFDDFRRAVHINRVLLDLGYLTLKDGCETGQSLFRDVDWARTRAYACGFSAMYLNVRGREGQGIVAPRELPMVLSSLRKDLLAYVDAETGQHPFREVLLSQQVYQDQRDQNSPDLIVGCTPGYRFSWQTALGGVPPVAIEDNKKKWRGDHIFAASSVPGILLIRNAPASPPKDIQSVGQYILSQFWSRANTEQNGSSIHGGNNE